MREKKIIRNRTTKEKKKKRGRISVIPGKNTVEERMMIARFRCGNQKRGN